MLKAMVRPALESLHSEFSSCVEYTPPRATNRDRMGRVTATRFNQSSKLKAHINFSPTPEQITVFGDVPEARVRAVLTFRQCDIELEREGSIKLLDREANNRVYSILAVTRTPLDTFYRVLIGDE
jgi:hypothetical protein